MIGSKFGTLIGQGVFSRRTLENQSFPLKASIAYTTLPCANALACDQCSLTYSTSVEAQYSDVHQAE
jgi:hypothetical protein